MSVWIRLGLGLFVLVPRLVQAATLEIPGNGDSLSGIGVISGWKCEAAGDITVRINGGDPVGMVYGSERGDTRDPCGDTDNGFLATFNYALLGDGEYTAVAYDNGVEFDRNTFRVATLGEEFVRDAQARVRVPNFPSSGEEAWFEWNQATQHLELYRSAPMTADDICMRLESSQNDPVSSTSLLLPPPLLCPIGESFDGDYLIYWAPGPADCATAAPRGTMQVQIERGEISGSTRAPPHGRLRVSGEVCHENGLFIGQWSLDGRFQGVFTGSLTLNEETCEKRWQDTARCTGDFNIVKLPWQ